MFLRIAQHESNWIVGTDADENWQIDSRGEAGIALKRPGHDFPCAIVDRRQPALSVTPHPTGRVPIFYAFKGDWIELADHPRLLLGDYVRLDRIAVAEYFLDRRRVSPGERSLLDGVYRIPPDMILRWTPSNGVTLVRGAAPEASISLNETIETVHAAITSEMHRIDDGGRIACLLSGGLDSSTVASLALEAIPDAKDRLVLLSARDVASADENRLQERVVATLRLPHVTPRVRPHVSLDALRALNRDATAPSGGLFSGVYHDIAEAAAASDIGTIMGGEGGEELFEPHPYIIADLLRRRHVPHALLATSYFASIQLAATGMGVLYEYGILPIVSGERRHVDTELLRRLLGPFADEVAAHSRVAASFPATATLEALHDVAALPYYEPAWSGAHPRFVSPLAAPEVVRGALSLRLTERISPFAARSKRLLRILAAGRIPADVRLTPKVGVADLLARFSRGHEQELADVVSAGVLADIGIAPSDEFANPANIPASSSLLWVLLLVLTIWFHEVRKWITGPPRLSMVWQYGCSS